MKTLKASAKIFAFLICVVLIIPTQSLVLCFIKDGPKAYYLPWLWHNAVRAAFGIRYKIIGKPYTGHQTLYMSNHLSYLDIPLLGSVIKSSFLAKSDVETWPLFGFLSRLQQTAFIQRKRTAIKREKDALQNRLSSGESLIIFPEGTSTDGQEVLPFKSSLFALALTDDTKDLYLQPVTIQVLEVDGRPPRTQEERDLYAWHINMDTPLHEHLWTFAQTSGAQIQITFHEPIRAHDYQDRKTLAKLCHDNVSKGLKKTLAA